MSAPASYSREVTGLVRRRTIWLWILLLALLCAGEYVRISKQKTLEVDPLVAGKGTAYLVQAPSGALVLINTGSDASILRALGSRLPPWQRSLAAVILTDPSPNSAGGLAAVLSRYRVPLLLRSAAQGAPTREQAISAAVAQHGTHTVSAERGVRLVLGQNTSIDLLWPVHEADRGSGAVTTVVPRISYGQTALVLERGLPSQARRWLAHIAESASSGALLLSSTSPPLISDGAQVRFLK